MAKVSCLSGLGNTLGTYSAKQPSGKTQHDASVYGDLTKSARHEEYCNTTLVKIAHTTYVKWQKVAYGFHRVSYQSSRSDSCSVHTEFRIEGIQPCISMHPSFRKLQGVCGHCLSNYIYLYYFQFL